MNKYPVVYYLLLEIDGKLQWIAVNEKEDKVLHLLCKGSSRKQIKEVLCMCDDGPKDYCKQLKRKFGVKNMNELIHVFTVAYGLWPVAYGVVWKGKQGSEKKVYLR